MPLDVDRNGRCEAGLNTFVAIDGDVTVVADPMEHEPPEDWTWLLPEYVPSAGVDRGLSDLGLDPLAVDHVVLSHRHVDHLTGVFRPDRSLRFPNARHWLHSNDWPVENPERWDGVKELADLERSGVLELFEGDQQLSPAVTLVHAPGETPGHCVLRVSSGDATAYFLGDLFHHPIEVRYVDREGIADLPTQTATRETIFRQVVDERALLTAAHTVHPRCWGRIIPDGDGHRWVFEDELPGD